MAFSVSMGADEAACTSAAAWRSDGAPTRIGTKPRACRLSASHAKFFSWPAAVPFVRANVQRHPSSRWQREWEPFREVGVKPRRRRTRTRRKSFAGRPAASQQIDQVEPVLLAKLQQRNSIGVRFTLVKTLAFAVDCAAFARVARNLSGQPAAERRVRCVDHAIVVRQIETREHTLRFVRNGSVPEASRNLVVERLQIFADSVIANRALKPRTPS